MQRPLLLLGAGLLLGVSARAAADFKVMSLNCYAFPAGSRAALKKVTGALAKLRLVEKEVDLTAGIDQPIHQRVRKNARFFLGQKPDVVCCQELWKEENKKIMIHELHGHYPHAFYNHAFYKNRLKAHNPAQMDDGLLIASRVRPFFHDTLTYSDKAGDEQRAEKGALLVGLTEHGSTWLVVDTHLQAGTEPGDLAIKDKQIRQLGRRILDDQARQPRLKHARVVVIGDFNEPITWRQARGQLVNRTQWMADAFRQAGLDLDNRQEVDQLLRKYQIRQEEDIYELQGKGILKDAQGRQTGTTTSSQDPLVRQFNDNKIWGWSYWEDATEPTGLQILDTAFLSPACQLRSLKTYRKEILGDQPSGKPYDSRAATSDHAAIMLTFAP
jgi:endonuclease/exonuclease/phosphatase family metal-dependent hydrolase